MRALAAPDVLPEILHLRLGQTQLSGEQQELLRGRYGDSVKF